MSIQSIPLIDDLITVEAVWDTSFYQDYPTKFIRWAYYKRTNVPQRLKLILAKIGEVTNMDKYLGTYSWKEWVGYYKTSH